MTQNKKPKWDGKSRITTKVYRKHFNEIFKKKEKTESEKLQDELEPIVNAPMMDKE